MDADESTFHAREPFDDQKCGLHPRLIRAPLTQAHGFPKKTMSDLPLSPISAIRNGHKREFFLPLFCTQICEQTRVCYTCYRLLFEELSTSCAKQYDNHIMLKVWVKSVFWCNSYLIFSVSENFWRSLYFSLPAFFFTIIFSNKKINQTKSNQPEAN